MVTFISEAHDPTESAAEKSNYLRYTLPTPGAELLICFFAAFRVRYTEARRLVGVSLRPDGLLLLYFQCWWHRQTIAMQMTRLYDLQYLNKQEIESECYNH